MQAFPHGQPVRHWGALRVGGNTTGLSSLHVSEHEMHALPHLHPLEHPAALGAGNTSVVGAGAGFDVVSVSLVVSFDGRPRSIHGLLGGSAALALRSRSA